MNAPAVLSSLPPYQGDVRLIQSRQDVYDIVKEILSAHKEFSSDYDKIALCFLENTTKKTCDALFDFCKKNIAYKQEPEGRQTTKSPAAIIAEGYGDCKHYASFCGGVLDAINRLGRKINWHYRFASYSIWSADPEHIFVVVKDKGKEIWIDPTPGAGEAAPVWTLNKKPKSMALYRISGTPEAVEFIATDEDFSPVEKAIAVLIYYGAMNSSGQISESRMRQLKNQVDPYTYENILQAQRLILEAAAAMGSIFKKLWYGVKKVTLSAPRNAFLSLVAINAFNFGKKLYNSLYKKDGSYTDFKDKLKKKWESLGGTFDALERAIRSGYRKARVSGIGSPPQVPAWVTIAGAIIAAIMPLVNAFLKSKQPAELPLPDFDYKQEDLPTQTSGGDPMEFIKKNPLIVIGGVAAIVLLTRKK